MSKGNICPIDHDVESSSLAVPDVDDDLTALTGSLPADDCVEDEVQLYFDGPCHCHSLPRHVSRQPFDSSAVADGDDGDVVLHRTNAVLLEPSRRRYMKGPSGGLAQPTADNRFDRTVITLNVTVIYCMTN